MALAPNHLAVHGIIKTFVEGSTGADVEDLDLDNPPTLKNCICKGCGSYLPMVQLLKPDDVRREIGDRTERIFANRNELHEILRRHEATIQRRWTKKTRQQRVKILLKAWPNMPQAHRPDFNILRKTGFRPAVEFSDEYRKCFIFPYINQEDLSKPKPLLLMVNSRGRHCPSEFAAADIEAASLGVISTVIPPTFLARHTMSMTDIANDQEYGKLMAWDSDAAAKEWNLHNKGFTTTEGLLVLEAQDRILSFLVECCREILHDLPADTLTSDKYSIQPEPVLKTGGELNGSESTATMAAEAPYRVPGQLDLHRVELLLSAKLSAVQDHIWALREDPGYLAEQVLTAKEHRVLWHKIFEAAAPVLGRRPEEILLASVVGLVVGTAYLQLQYISDLHRQAQELRSLQQVYDSGPQTSKKSLSEEYLQALLKFRIHLNQASRLPISQLAISFSSSPPLRKFYLDKQIDPVKPQSVAKLKPNVKMNKVEREVNWLLCTLCKDSSLLTILGIPLLIDELERLQQSEPQARELISDLAASQISDISIISQCLMQLDLFGMWHKSPGRSFAEHAEKVQQECAKEFDSALWILEIPSDPGFTAIAQLADPSGGRLAYPFEKRRTKENVEALRRAERNLDLFWAKADEFLIAKGGKTAETTIRPNFLQLRSLQRTPEWVEPPVPAKKNRAPVVDVDALNGPLSALSFALDTSLSKDTGRSRDVIETRKTKAKAKTRGIPTQASAHETKPADKTDDADDTTPRPTFLVDARALKTFRTIFFNPAVTSTPGEIAWGDFVHALISMGFMAEKLYGSVWHFSPIKMDL